MSIYKTVCHCGHDQATHHEQQHTCLGMQCECWKYRDHLKPDEKKPVILRGWSPTDT